MFFLSYSPQRITGRWFLAIFVNCLLQRWLLFARTSVVRRRLSRGLRVCTHSLLCCVHLFTARLIRCLPSGVRCSPSADVGDSIDHLGGFVYLRHSSPCYYWCPESSRILDRSFTWECWTRTPLFGRGLSYRISSRRTISMRSRLVRPGSAAMTRMPSSSTPRQSGIAWCTSHAPSATHRNRGGGLCFIHRSELTVKPHPLQRSLQRQTFECQLLSISNTFSRPPCRQAAGRRQHLQAAFFVYTINILRRDVGFTHQGRRVHRCRPVHHVRGLQLPWSELNRWRRVDLAVRLPCMDFNSTFRPQHTTRRRRTTYLISLSDHPVPIGSRRSRFVLPTTFPTMISSCGLSPDYPGHCETPSRTDFETSNPSITPGFGRISWTRVCSTIQPTRQVNLLFRLTRSCPIFSMHTVRNKLARSWYPPQHTATTDGCPRMQSMRSANDADWKDCGRRMGTSTTALPIERPVVSPTKPSTASRRNQYAEKIRSSGSDSRKRWSAIRDVLHSSGTVDVQAGDRTLCETFAAFFTNKIRSVKAAIAARLTGCEIDALRADGTFTGEQFCDATASYSRRGPQIDWFDAGEVLPDRQYPDIDHQIVLRRVCVVDSASRDPLFPRRIISEQLQNGVSDPASQEKWPGSGQSC